MHKGIRDYSQYLSDIEKCWQYYQNIFGKKMEKISRSTCDDDIDIAYMCADGDYSKEGSASGDNDIKATIYMDEKNDNKMAESDEKESFLHYDDETDYDKKENNEDMMNTKQMMKLP